MNVFKVVFFALFCLVAFACGSMMVGVSSFSCETEGDCLSGYRCLNGECVEGGGSASSSSSGSSAPSSSSLISSSSQSGGGSRSSGSSRSSSTTASSGASSASSSSLGTSSRQSSSAGTSQPLISSSAGGQSSSLAAPSSSIQIVASQGATSAGVSSSIAESSSATPVSSIFGSSSSATVTASSSAPSSSSGTGDPCLDAPKLLQISCVVNTTLRECLVTGLAQPNIWLTKPYPSGADPAAPTRLALKHEVTCQTSGDTCNSTPWNGTVDDFSFNVPVASHFTVCVTNANLTVNDPVHGYDVDTCLDLCRATLIPVDGGALPDGGNINRDVGQWYPSDTVRDTVFVP